MQIYILGKYFHINASWNIPSKAEAKTLTDLSDHLKLKVIEGPSPSFKDVKSMLKNICSNNILTKKYKEEIVIDFFNHLFIDDLKDSK